MPLKCCVKTCVSTGMTRHRFPNPRTHMDLFNKWLDVLKIEELRLLEPAFVYANRRVCFAHFNPKFKSEGNPRLHRNAIPTLGLLPESQETDHPSEIILSDGLYADSSTRLMESCPTPESQETEISRETSTAGLMESYPSPGTSGLKGLLLSGSVAKQENLDRLEEMCENEEKQCRTCLVKPNELISIAADHVICENVISVLNLLKLCCDVEIALQDGFPQFVCSNCIHLAEKCYEFRLQCKQADETLRSNGLKLEEISIKSETSEVRPDVDDSEADEINVYIDDDDPDYVPDNEEEIIEEIRVERKTLKSRFVCKECNLTFPTQTALSTHEKSHFYKCTDCPLRFITKDLLAQHETTHNKTELNKTDEETSEIVITVETIAPESLDPLDDDEINPRKFAGIIKPNKAAIRTNLAYKCKVCQENFTQLREIKDHLNTHAIDTQELFNHLLYKCTECTEEFGTIYEYFRHSPTHSANLDKMRRNTPRTQRFWKCNIVGCEKTFPSENVLKQHNKTHDALWPKKCQFCGVVLHKIFEYMTHMNTEHEDQKKLLCTQCGKKFFSVKNLRTHLLIHKGEKKFMCDFCGFKFQARNNLVVHRRIHTGDKPYTCSYCPRSFTQHASLRSHELNHNGEKKFECTQCDKKFLRICSLRNHLKTHFGIKDFACHICGAKFGTSSTRKKHYLTHTGERNHKCEFCGKAFSRTSHLNVHRKIHTGETPHVCDLCGKGFIQAHQLRSHLNTHRKHAARDKEMELKRTKRKSAKKQKVEESDEEDSN